ncbi:MAG: hypothetical protein M3176_07670 [Chloroflexota bacterium]|nr:hypothetical protein [Chloroflexota bacterium]
MQTLFNYLPLLACPLGMGLMMWMMRGKKDTPMQGMQDRAGDVAANQPPPALHPDDRLTILHGQLDDVQEQIARLAAEDRTPVSSGRGTGGAGER